MYHVITFVTNLFSNGYLSCVLWNCVSFRSLFPQVVLNLSYQLTFKAIYWSNTAVDVYIVKPLVVPLPGAGLLQGECLGHNPPRLPNAGFGYFPNAVNLLRCAQMYNLEMSQVCTCPRESNLRLLIWGNHFLLGYHCFLVHVYVYISLNIHLLLMRQNMRVDESKYGTGRRGYLIPASYIY